MAEPLRVGDRVRVYPRSHALADLRGAEGTVEVVVPATGGPIDEALYVRVDKTGETLGIGPDCVVPLGENRQQQGGSDA
jgi:hypothetical protein